MRRPSTSSLCSRRGTSFFPRPSQSAAGWEAMYPEPKGYGGGTGRHRSAAGRGNGVVLAGAELPSLPCHLHLTLSTSSNSPNPATLSLTPSTPPSPIASTETSAPPTASAPGRPATEPPWAAAGSSRSYGMNWPSRTPRRSPRRTAAVRYDSPPLTSTSTIQAPPRCSTNRPNECLPSRCSTKRPNEGVSKALSINVATFEKQLKKLTFAHLLKALKNPRHSLTGCNCYNCLCELGICMNQRYCLGLSCLIWFYNFIFFFPLNLFKFGIGFILSGWDWDNLLENKTAFTTKKDYEKEEREAQWALAQRTLHELQFVKSPTIYNERSNYREL